MQRLHNEQFISMTRKLPDIQRRSFFGTSVFRAFPNRPLFRVNSSEDAESSSSSNRASSLLPQAGQADVLNQPHVTISSNARHITFVNNSDGLGFGAVGEKL